MDNSGWIKVFRSLMNKCWYSDSEYVHLWLHLLLKANHKEAEVLLNNKIVKIKSGQFITGRKKLSKETGINESKIERILKCFESDQQIEQQTNSKSRLISISYWNEYQDSEQQKNNKRTTREQHVNTNKNDKEQIKNEKKISFVVFWDLYDKKEQRDSCEKKWNALDLETQEKIISVLPDYVKWKNEKQYRPNPQTFLNQKRWLDEIPKPKIYTSTIPAEENKW